MIICNFAGKQKNTMLGQYTYHVKQLSREEKAKVFMRLRKSVLVEMLIDSNEILGGASVVYYPPQAPPRASLPLYPQKDAVCDICGCHPSVIIYTPNGKFCVDCLNKKI